jgi:hypothetical protein
MLVSSHENVPIVGEERMQHVEVVRGDGDTRRCLMYEDGIEDASRREASSKGPSQYVGVEWTALGDDRRVVWAYRLTLEIDCPPQKDEFRC